MNYFELFGLPIQLSVDKSLLAQRFQKLIALEDNGHSRTGIPVSANSDPQHAAVISTAYKTLINQDETIRYVLYLKDLMHEDEKYEPDPEFMTAIYEMGETLAELTEGEEDKLEALESEVKDLLKKTYADVEHIVENYEEGAVSEKELLQVKEYYYRKKYLQRVLDKVAQLRNIAAL
jgi:molecular chaperone HscB